MELLMVNQRFEREVLCHLDSAYNLARWLTRNPLDAEDVVQESVLRAFKYYRTVRGDTRAWFLRIVRNTAFTWLKKRRPEELQEELLDTVATSEGQPEAIYMQVADGDALRRAIEALPVVYAEVIMLREVEGLSYKEIADIADVPVGTVMSRLARARKRLQESLGPTYGPGARS
jgi:RNA polymerase sigma-70 factor (ECF subfamily)